ncbi:MAG: CDP-diacylglycerol--serine O-phosphatidyltransferase [Prevotellaceae bacterium]|jgi:CDP-diacylglycerol--serine O-phosphatidyltransferase|nr:CDP-diacylglycerol--serine O-phosphatidyltransferase [Prevotellaceae bacterium]
MADKIKTATIPNFITCLNLLSGCVGIVLAFGGNNVAAMICLLLAAVFDFFDGFVARLLKSRSPVGVELDSLADMVSFGLLPAAMLFRFISGSVLFLEAPAAVRYIVSYMPFVLTIFSALRLAKFNVDDRQTTSFIGLPTPANALFFSSLSLGLGSVNDLWLTLALIVVFSYLMVSEIPMFSLKIKNFSVKKYAFQLALATLSGVAIAQSFFGGIPVLSAFAPIILLYILLSVAKWLLKL